MSLFRLNKASLRLPGVLCKSSVPCIIFLGLIKSLSTMESKMKAVTVDNPGGPDVMKIGYVERPNTKENEILIKVYGSAINRADTLQRQGKYPPPKGESIIMGLEAAGVIESIGVNVPGNFTEGDRVMALLGGGGYAEYATADYRSVLKIPNNMTMTTASAIPETFLTAYQLLKFVADFQPNKKVLIHAGGSGVGTAAIQIVRNLGGIPYVTAGTQKKLDKALSLGAELAVNYKEEDFSEAVLKHTDGKGVDIILDCIGGSYAEKNVKSIAVDGQWVLYGLMGGINPPPAFLGQILRKRIQLLGTTLRTRSKEYKGELVNSFTKDLMHHLETGKIQPIIDQIFPLEKIVDAHKHMEASGNTGKICLEILKEETAHNEL